MSEQTLYQPDLDRMYDDERQMFDGLVKYGRLVPVKECEHDKLDGHWIQHKYPKEWEWCLGAGIRDADVDYETHTLMQGGIGGSDE